ncbi:aspartate aminotransferase family protein [Priestia endophytica]|uniref:Aspartate aminotransferase family protein n=1 Tax=Priestia endophytica TaxID=135735 RepID=A0AAX1QCL1_9BACI|nr:aspartate aminotransferase family protein [Priestia endophytica]RAS80636.1 aspartate aminotransferase family protein [Priestia endophytica]RAS86023.1 aspartate aminotransferase family protein [Priestia endophytica]
MKNQTLYTLAELDKQHILHPSTSPAFNRNNGPTIIFERGEGLHIFDMDNNKYIDGVSMLWNVNVGHGNKELAQVSFDQMQKLAYSSMFYGYSNEPAVKLAEKITSMTPGDLDSVFYTSGGSESNDTAFKLARFYWERKGLANKKKIISLKRGYHGVTVAAQRATGIEVYRAFSGSGDPDIINAEPHLTSCELGDINHPSYQNSIRGTIEREGANHVAAVIIEPIQGAGGVHVPPEDYLQAVRKLCDEQNILLIADEVICGFGRTGRSFGVNHWDIVPDLMSVAKGITSGYAQLGAVVMRTPIMDAICEVPDMLAHGFTYSGHPTACTVGLKNLEIIERENLIDQADQMGKLLLKGFDYLNDKYQFFHNGRGRGLLTGFDLIKDPEQNITFTPEEAAAMSIVEECKKRGLLIRGFDFEPGMNIVAIAPPLISQQDDIETIISIVDESLSAYSKRLGL